MNVLIVEDEVLAAERIQTLIMATSPQAKVIETLDTVTDTISFLQSGGEIDLLVMDLQLADGKSLEVFEKIQVNTPVIFTTAYDEYAIEAYKCHSIDYLLKPVQYADMERALKKFERLNSSQVLPAKQIDILKKILNNKPAYKERFLIKVGNKTQFRQTTDVAFIFAEGKNAFIVTQTENRKYLIDHTLEELEKILNPDQFFRINRKQMINVDSIREIKGQISTKLEVILSQSCDQELWVSRDRATDFKRWIDR